MIRLCVEVEKESVAITLKKTKTNILKNKRRTGLNSFTASRYQYLYIIYSVFPTLSDDLIWILEDQNIVGFMS